MKPQKSSTTFIGIAGGSGSGKTTLATALHERLGARQSVIMSCDWYYKDFSHLSPADRAAVNFDHPDALDIDLFSHQIRQLQARKPIVAPVYDFTTHRRTSDPRILKPTPIVLIEGILLFAIKPICTYLDLKIFVDAPADIRFIRRLKRDIEERGRTVDSVVQQYLTTTRPMHHAFVEPSKAAADVVVSGEEDIESLTGRVMERIESLSRQAVSDTELYMSGTA